MSQTPAPRALLILGAAMLTLSLGACGKKDAKTEAAPVEVLPTVVDQPRDAPPSPAPPRKPLAAAKRCPVCAKEFRDESVFCTEDGAGLVAVGAPPAAPAVAAPRVRVCPRCQRRYEALMDFCVDDGVRLNDG